jgi:hypothetical protein
MVSDGLGTFGAAVSPQTSHDEMMSLQLSPSESSNAAPGIHSHEIDALHCPVPSGIQSVDATKRSAVCAAHALRFQPPPVTGKISICLTDRLACAVEGCQRRRIIGSFI